MNLLADAMEPYLKASGIAFTRNDPNKTAAGAIADSNSAYYDAHIALHSNASPESLSGQLRGIDIYFSPYSMSSERLAITIANNLKSIYLIPSKVTARPTTTLGEVNKTNAVAVLCELGYHDNEEDANWIRSSLDAIASNITESLCDYFGIPFIMPTQVVKGVVVTDGSGLNLRSYPSINGARITSIPNGEAVTVYGSANNWYVVTWKNYTGYVLSDFIVIG
ncbi:MAG: SH3 domain-containing protein [Oscillospiraceae bacterium]|nr:SH3 domain-containing protein [Oscillospiraceae bacterium]